MSLFLWFFIFFWNRISYLEIYNGAGYDLLDPSHDNSTIDDLPKVKMYDDGNGVLVMKNIGVMPANNEVMFISYIKKI